eukprot:40024_1
METEAKVMQEIQSSQSKANTNKETTIDIANESVHTDTITDDLLCRGIELHGKAWIITICVDILLVLALLIRPYDYYDCKVDYYERIYAYKANVKYNYDSNVKHQKDCIIHQDFGYNRLIGHYYSWVPITDSFVLWLHPNRRAWWLPFRVLTGIEATILNVIFIVWNADTINSHLEWAVPMQIVRLSICIIYIIHSVWMYRKYGPTYDNVIALVKHIQNQTVQPAPLIYMGLFALFCGNIFYKFHYNYDHIELDAPLTGIQTARSITVFTKAAFISVLIVDLFYRGLAHLIVSMLFIVQWFMFPEMFMKAPIPYCHCVGEVAFVAWSLFLLHNAGWKPRNDVNWKGYTIHLWKKMINN